MAEKKKRVSNKSTGRNYRLEYDNYAGRPEQIARRSSRNQARRIMEKAGVVRKGDGRDVDHKNSNPLGNAKNNLRAVPKSQNRSFPRTKTAREKRK